MKTTPHLSCGFRSTCAPPTHWLGLAAGLALALGSLHVAVAQGPSIAADHSAYYPGEDITFSFANGPGNSKDWIGLYPQGVEPGSVGSTRWYYVDNTQGGTKALKEGTVKFGGGLGLAGDWDAHLLLNDGYTKLVMTTFVVVDPSSPLLRTDKGSYAIGEPISVTFTNGPANPKDWIGLYRTGSLPGGTPSILWRYTDGGGGATGMTDGQVSFANGLTTPGTYVAFFLANDGYDILASDPFTVFDPLAAKVRVLSAQPANNAQNLPPTLHFTFVITNGATKLVASSVELRVDGTKVAHALAQQGELATVSYTNDTLFAPASDHAYELIFADNASPAGHYTNQAAFHIAAYRNIVLPAPLYFENFDSTPEGELPPGWTGLSFTDVTNPDLDLGNLDSASYAGWTVVAADRFTGTFVTYSNSDAASDDYRRVLTVNPLNVLNGQIYDQPLAQGRFAFGNSGYRNGRSQVLYLFTPDFDLSGKSDVFVSFHSLWEQNQDSVAAVEYSIDQGQTWLPIVYLMDGPDILRDPVSGAVDAQATLETAHGDAAVYADPVTGEDVGGNYGAFIGVDSSMWSTLAPYISARVNDDPLESKRIELFRLPQADNQTKVRLRFAHAGTDSWYFGIDDFGLYSIPTVTRPKIDKQPADLTVTEGEAASLMVQVSGVGPFTYAWFHNDQPVNNAAAATLSIAAAKVADAGRYFVRISNAAGPVDSDPAILKVNPRPPAVSGAWDFDQESLALTAGVGLLEYADGEATMGLTSFGVTDGATVPHIGGQPARFMRVPAFTGAANGYNLTMPTTPNGGGGYVNRYTIVLDLLLPGSVNWTPLFNTNPGNGNDADFYVSDAGALGILALGYSAAGAIVPDMWYRVAFAADLGAGQVTYYVNGQPVRVRTGGSLLDGRFALYSGADAGPDLRFFNEPTGGYTHELLINSLMFTDRRMSAEEIGALGGPSAAGIPADLSTAPLSVSVRRDGNSITLSWAGGTGPYQVQKTASLTNPSWQNVGSPTAGATWSDEIGAGAAFYRVVGQ